MTESQNAIPEDLRVAPVAPLVDDQLPSVAIIILNWNGKHHLAGCFDSLSELDYPPDRRHVYLIDNGSDDGSIEEVKRSYPWVRLHCNKRNLGFSRGCNQGAELAQEAGVLVFLNNDMRVEPSFLRELVTPVVQGQCQATTGKMLSWDGKLMNSAGGGMNFHGIGIQRGYMAPPEGEFDLPCKTLFACGGAMAVDAQTFREVGGFDEDFFAYYEDVDLGWRMWILGHEVHYAPEAVCYHHHSSTSRRVPVERLRLLQVRNPLLACFKNYDDENLGRILPAMLALASRRCYLWAGLGDAEDFRIERLKSLPSTRGPGAWLAKLKKLLRGQASMSRIATADLVAINDLLGRWDYWRERRRTVQTARKRPDSEILRLFLRPLWCIEQEAGYKELHEGLVEFSGLDSLFQGCTSMDADPKG